MCTCKLRITDLVWSRFNESCREWEIFIQTQTNKIHSTDFVPCEIYNRKQFVSDHSLSHFSDQSSKNNLVYSLSPTTTIVLYKSIGLSPVAYSFLSLTYLTPTLIFEGFPSYISTIYLYIFPLPCKLLISPDNDY